MLHLENKSFFIISIHNYTQTFREINSLITIHIASSYDHIMSLDQIIYNIFFIPANVLLRKNFLTEMTGKHPLPFDR